MFLLLSCNQTIIKRRFIDKKVTMFTQVRTIHEYAVLLLCPFRQRVSKVATLEIGGSSADFSFELLSSKTFEIPFKLLTFLQNLRNRMAWRSHGNSNFELVQNLFSKILH